MRKLLIKISLMIILSLQFSYTYAEEALVIQNSSILDLKKEKKAFLKESMVIVIQDKPGQFYTLTLRSRSNESDFVKYKKTQENTIIPMSRDVDIYYGDLIHGTYKEAISEKENALFIILLICIFFGLPLCILPLLFNLKLSRV